MPRPEVETDFETMTGNSGGKDTRDENAMAVVPGGAPCLHDARNKKAAWLATG